MLPLLNQCAAESSQAQPRKHSPADENSPASHLPLFPSNPVPSNEEKTPTQEASSFVRLLTTSVNQFCGIF
jgi:hypothetical protein